MKGVLTELTSYPEDYHLKPNRVRVLVDALSAREGGGVTDLLNLLPAMEATCGRIELAVVLSPVYQSDLFARIPESIEVISADVPETSLVRRYIFLQTEIPRLVTRLGAQVLLSMSELSSSTASCPQVVLVRNLNLFASRGTYDSVWRDLSSLLYRMSRRPLVKKSLTRADHIVVVSRTFMDEIVRVYPSVRDKSQIVYLGLDPGFCGLSTQQEPAWNRPFILAVSGIAPHKNLETLIRAFALLVERPAFSDYELLIAGNLRLRRVHRELVRLCELEGIVDNVKFLGRLPHSDLPPIYKAASVFVLPSRLEAFGHPLLEAMACGAPIVASDIPICREICGDAASYFPASDPNVLAETMVRVVEDVGLRESTIRNGKLRVQQFSWTKTARAIEQALIKVAVDSPTGRPS